MTARRLHGFDLMSTHTASGSPRRLRASMEPNSHCERLSNMDDFDLTQPIGDLLRALAGDQIAYRSTGEVPAAVVARLDQVIVAECWVRSDEL